MKIEAAADELGHFLYVPLRIRNTSSGYVNTISRVMSGNTEVVQSSFLATRERIPGLVHTVSVARMRGRRETRRGGPQLMSCKVVICCVRPDGQVDSFVKTRKKDVVWIRASGVRMSSFLDDLASSEITSTEDTKFLEVAYQTHVLGRTPDVYPVMVVFQGHKHSRLGAWETTLRKLDAAYTKSTEDLVEAADVAGAVRVFINGKKHVLRA